MSEFYSAANDLAIILKKSDATLLECLQCSQTFSNREDLMEHAESHNQPQKYQCKICYKYLATKSSMKNHNRIHRQRKNVCEKCGKGFYILGRLKSHMEIIHGEELRHFCPQCPKAFAVLRSLESHIKNAHGKKEYNCTICDKWFLKKYALAEHLSIVHSSARSFHCEICDKMYATKRAIRYHISKSHSERTYPCPYCGKVLATPSSLSVHVKNIHQKTREQCNKCQKYHANQIMDVCPHTTQLEVCRFHCQICDLKFRTRNELKSHNFVVHKEKQHLCDECGQVFDTGAELESHTAVHSTEKRFMCDICGKKYRGQSSLKRHRLNHFEKQFQCPLCDRKFTRDYLLRLHMPIHTNEKNIQCTFCPMFFRSRASLKQHEFIKHKTKARFTCKICAKTFNILRAFKQHQKKHEKRYECDICKKQIGMKNKLQEHVEMHMNLNEGPDDYLLSCAECSRKFKSAEKMKQHMSSHLNARPFRCNVCEKSFSTAGNLQSHSKYHVKKQAHLCEQCGYTCLFEEVLENHIQKYHSGANEIRKAVEGFFPQDAQEDEVTERFSCEECDRHFESLQLLKLHKKTHLYECATCKQNLRTEKMLSAHIKKEHRTKTVRKCSYCDKSFTKKIHLVKHERSHKVNLTKSTKKANDKPVKRDRRKTSEKPIGEKQDQRKTVGEKSVNKVETEGAAVAIKKYHPCKKCDLMFGTFGRLRMHMKTYHADAVRVTEKKESKTAEADQSAAIVQETVDESESKMEAKSGEKNEAMVGDIVDERSQSAESPTSGPIQGEKVLIQCQRCDQDFINEETFITHMRSHDPKVKMLHRCQECERTFDQMETLVEHKSRHQDKSIVPTFCCPLCDMIFKTQKGMKIHLMKIHKHWKCQYCSQVLSTDLFQTHLLTHVTETVSKMDIEEMNKTVLESNVESEESYLKRQKLRVLHHCPYCDFSFTMFKNLNAHLGKIHQFFKCRPCNLIIPLDKVEQHMGSEVHKADKMFKCTDCGLEFSNFNKLYYHRRRKHMFKCPECVMTYLPNLESYKDHLKSHGINVGGKKNMTDQTANYTCAECGKTFQTKAGLGKHLRDMLKPKPRWQKVIFRCDPICTKCKFCKKPFRHITSHLQDGVCPEKRKQEWEKNLSGMKAAIEIAVFKAKQSRKLELEARRLKRQRMKEQSNMVVGGLFGYDVNKGKCKKIVCRYCPNIFYHPDGYEYHLKFRCVGGRNAKRPVSGVGLKECRVLIRRVNLPSALDGKRRRRPPKCFCCKGEVCKNVVNIYKGHTNQMERHDEFECNRQEDELNEEDVLQALDIKVEAEYISDHTYSNCSFLIRRCETEPPSYTENEFDYQRKLESTMESIKEQFETFNTMTENNYHYYNKTWPKAGMEFCILEAAKKPLQDQTWSYVCYQRPVQMIDITDNDGRCHDKQFAWNIKCNSISPPPCVDEAIKVFQDFFDSWKVLVDPFLSKQELINFRKEIITIDIEADSSKNLSVLITLCNENTSVEKAFGYYFSCANVPNIKCITYKNIETDENGKTAFKTTLIFGNKPTDKMICGIKVNLEEFSFVEQLGSLQVMSHTIENYLQSDLNYILMEFGCKNGFLSASLSDKYGKVIGFDVASEIATGRRLCYYNNITNVTYVEATSSSITSVIESVTNEQLHVIVNIDMPWITNLHIMRMLRSLNHLKSIVLVTTFSPKVYLPILELITADPSFFGYSFIPIRSCVIQKTEDKSQFQIIMLLLREDVYEQKPIKIEPVDVSSLVETTIEENTNK